MNWHNATMCSRSEERRVGKECRCRWSPAHWANKVIEHTIREGWLGNLALETFVFSSRRRHTRSVSAFLLNRSSDLCLFVCRALSSIMVICMLTAIRLLLTFVMSLYLLLRS